MKLSEYEQGMLYTALSALVAEVGTFVNEVDHGSYKIAETMTSHRDPYLYIRDIRIVHERALVVLDSLTSKIEPPAM